VPKATAKGDKHPILREFDAELQHFSGTMDALAVNKQANILVESKDGRPLLATTEQGNGRVLFLNTSSSWKWRRDALAAGKTGENYYDFWEQALKWVIHDPALNQVRLVATKTTADPLGMSVVILLRDRDYEAADSARAHLRIIPLDNKAEPAELEFTTNAKGEARVTFEAGRPGYFRLQLKEEPWKSLARPGTIFLGGSQDELRNLDLVPETLQRLANFSGGRFFTSEAKFQPDSLVWGEVQNKTIVETQRLKLRNWIWSLPILLLIAAVEWAVRRSSHLA